VPQIRRAKRGRPGTDPFPFQKFITTFQSVFVITFKDVLVIGVDS
jgi:hypothetical protein